MIASPVWDESKLDEERAKSRAAFVAERLDEPLEDYLEAFELCQGFIEEVMELTVDLSDLQSESIQILRNKDYREVFRYLAAPPISMDDWKEIADMRSFSKQSLKDDPDGVLRLVQVVHQVIDRRRFPWVGQDVEPLEAEKQAAVIASAALMAQSRTQTLRRNVGKQRQEALVKAALIELGYTEVKSRKIKNISKAPEPYQFCGESTLGNRKADIVVRLPDERLMPIECKVSNSSTNSVKRLNNDAAVKAVSWRVDFGKLQIVPSAVLGGVYKLHNLVDAQDRGLTIFWAHDLDALVGWLSTAAENA